MEDLAARFKQAAVDVKKLGKKPENDTLLKLYALFKQGEAGDVSGERPGGGFDFVGRAKYDSWVELKGLSQAEAQQRYVDLVAELLAKN
jgi:acyl-CoA-binding protein